ncbi:MAG TPA: TIGR00282 family metallophosphoesterase [Trueperaceae bacterium]|nr:TIGR00282 family metallophosphoesterase [Trueperaceae bacterium]
MTADAREPAPSRILFVGDVVGEAGVAYLEGRLPGLRAELGADFVIVNGENVALPGLNPAYGCGISERDVERLLALGVDVITGGNHSWDGPGAIAALRHPRVLRPLNTSPLAPGRGAVIVGEDGPRLGVVNLGSRTAIPAVDHPYDAFQRQLAAWAQDGADAGGAAPGGGAPGRGALGPGAPGGPELVVVDFHGESVSEKQIFAWAVDGSATAVIGTHTHAPTLDTRVLPGGTAYVSDVGMVGPSGGMQGYEPDVFVASMRSRLPAQGRGGWASGPVEFGAVLITAEAGRAVAIERLPLEGEGGSA